MYNMQGILISAVIAASTASTDTGGIAPVGRLGLPQVTSVASRIASSLGVEQEQGYSPFVNVLFNFSKSN